MPPKYYTVGDFDLPQMATTLEQWLQSTKGCGETQILETPGGLTLQAKSTASWVQRQGVALTVSMMLQDNTLQVDVGTSKWTAQAVSGVAAMIVFWPLMAVPAFVAYKQKQLIDETWQYISQYVATAGGTMSGAPVRAMAAPAAQSMAAPQTTVPVAKCPSCGTKVDANAKFCNNCGAKLIVVCSECGATLRADSKFCDNCGTMVTA